MQEEGWYLDKKNKKFPDKTTRLAVKVKIHAKETPPQVALLFGVELAAAEPYYSPNGEQSEINKNDSEN